MNILYPKKDLTIKLYYPVVRIFNHDHYPPEVEDNLLKEMNGLKVNLMDEDNLSSFTDHQELEFEILESRPDDFREAEPSDILFHGRFIKVTYKVIFDFHSIGEVFYEGKPIESSNELDRTKYSYGIALISELMIERVRDIVLLAHISVPGSLVLDKGQIHIDHHYYYKEVPKVSNYMRRAYSEVLRFGWPDITNLSLNQVIRWSNEVELLFTSKTNTNLERALNTLSYVNNNYSIVEVPLFWILIGLEAIYVKGNVGISEQLNEKAQTFLGPLKEFKKEIKKMYAKRSSLIHGAANIPCSFRHNDNSETLDDELYRSTSLGLAILITTFQKMVELNIYELDFEYTLKTPSI